MNSYKWVQMICILESGINNDLFDPSEVGVPLFLSSSLALMADRSCPLRFHEFDLTHLLQASSTAYSHTQVGVCANQFQKQLSLA
jgi:hypothetical protein